jgi:hypothetical protein
MALLLKLDIVVIALGLPAFLALGVPVEAWLIIASAWLTQRWVRGWACAASPSRAARTSPRSRST